MATVLASGLEVPNAFRPAKGICLRALAAARARVIDINIGVLVDVFILGAAFTLKARMGVRRGSKMSRVAEVELRAHSCRNSFAAEGALAHGNGRIGAVRKKNRTGKEKSVVGGDGCLLRYIGM